MARLPQASSTAAPSVSQASSAAALASDSAESPLAPGTLRSQRPTTYVSTFEIVSSFAHKPDAFTQGLVFDDDGHHLYESDGIFRRSQVRLVEERSGRSITAVPTPKGQFGEGLAIVGNQLLQLTWKAHVVHVYALPSLHFVATRPLPCAPRCREGWGLAHDGRGTLYLTDSTDKLFVLDAHTLRDSQPPMRIFDHRQGRAVYGVNELEWVEGELWGNVYPMYQGAASQCVVRINASTGSVIGWIDLRGLLDRQRPAVRRAPRNFVLNGLAYRRRSQQLYATGKNWDQMFELRILPGERMHQSATHVCRVCGLGIDRGMSAAERRAAQCQITEPASPPPSPPQMASPPSLPTPEAAPMLAQPPPALAPLHQSFLSPSPPTLHAVALTLEGETATALHSLPASTAVPAAIAAVVAALGVLVGACMLLARLVRAPWQRETARLRRELHAARAESAGMLRAGSAAGAEGGEPATTAGGGGTGRRSKSQRVSRHQSAAMRVRLAAARATTGPVPEDDEL